MHHDFNDFLRQNIPTTFALDKTYRRRKERREPLPLDIFDVERHASRNSTHRNRKIRPLIPYVEKYPENKYIERYSEKQNHER